MTIKQDKQELRCKIRQLEEELNKEDCNRYIMTTQIEIIRELCKSVDSNSTARTTKNLTSRAYDLVSKASDKILEMLGY